MQKLARSTSRCLLYNDMFGHTITFNFDGNDRHKTIIGGAVSLVLRILIFFYIYLLARRLLFYERDEVATTLSLLDGIDDFRINYENLNITWFMYLEK